MQLCLTTCIHYQPNAQEVVIMQLCLKTCIHYQPNAQEVVTMQLYHYIVHQ